MYRKILVIFSFIFVVCGNQGEEGDIVDEVDGGIKKDYIEDRDGVDIQGEIETEECGNNRCDLGEDPNNCPQDCDFVCGDSLCDWEKGENFINCEEDCSGEWCGDGVCDYYFGESSLNCPQDCFCGDGRCDYEDIVSCEQDCNRCGDGWCDVELGESSESCPQDCSCGDSICDSSENRDNCPEDCCESDEDCPPTYYCDQELHECELITDCETRGCNEQGDPSIYCNTETGFCERDICRTEPCNGIANATGECVSLYGEDYLCICNSGYYWDIDNKSCNIFSCNAQDLGEFSGETIEVSGNSCNNGTKVYTTLPDGCTQFPALGKEIVYRIILPQNSNITVTAIPNEEDLDLSLYIIRSCDDLFAQSCEEGMGSDIGLSGDEESVTISNNTDSNAEYFIVVDSFYSSIAENSGCGSFVLIITSQ